MAKSNTNSSSASSTISSPTSQSLLLFLVTILVVPLFSAALFLVWIDPFDPAPIPPRNLVHSKASVTAPRLNARILRESEFVGMGRLLGPEDIVYEPGSRVLYTGCADGWVKKVKLGESGSDPVIEDLLNTGGRPLGLAIVSHGPEIIVADAHKGLLKITEDKEMKLLSNEAEDQKFKLTDGVGVAEDGMIYFTDASYKYAFEEHLYDLLESRPYGRLLSFNPYTGETNVLLRDLYFPNGVAVSPDQNSLIFCETPLKRCRRYWLQGSRKGSVDVFIDNLPGFPDNIHYDGQSNYLIAISSWLSPYLEQLRTHRLFRKSLVVLDRYISLQFLQKNGGILTVDLEGNPTAHFYDPSMSMISSGIRVGDHIYIGSLQYAHIIGFNLSSS